jgi:hypothetical protein
LETPHTPPTSEGDELDLPRFAPLVTAGQPKTNFGQVTSSELEFGNNMDNGLLNPRLAAGRARQIQDAKAMQQVVADRLTKKGLNVPPYEFLELIGKGSYGRVYKR